MPPAAGKACAILIISETRELLAEEPGCEWVSATIELPEEEKLSVVPDGEVLPE